MTYHILNGDAMLERFQTAGIDGEIVVARECLIEGPLLGETDEEFYRTRAAFIEETYGASKDTYFLGVATEFKKLNLAPNNSEFNLWFGYDLFCRANMWYVLSLLSNMAVDKTKYVVYPSYLKDDNIWKDFGPATTADLISCFNNRVFFEEKDIELGLALWTAFKSTDLTSLGKLSKQQSKCYPYLDAVCRAHIERFPEGKKKGRRERLIQELIENTTTDFPALFYEFSKREGIYGFGDSQVKRLYDKVMENR